MTKGQPLQQSSHQSQWMMHLLSNIDHAGHRLDTLDVHVKNALCRPRGGDGHHKYVSQTFRFGTLHAHRLHGNEE